MGGGSRGYISTRDGMCWALTLGVIRRDRRGVARGGIDDDNRIQGKMRDAVRSEIRGVRLMSDVRL